MIYKIFPLILYKLVTFINMLKNVCIYICIYISKFVLFVHISAVMENSKEEQREDINEEEPELTEEKTHHNLKGTFRTSIKICYILAEEKEL